MNPGSTNEKSNSPIMAPRAKSRHTMGIYMTPARQENPLEPYDELDPPLYVHVPGEEDMTLKETSRRGKMYADEIQESLNHIQKTEESKVNIQKGTFTYPQTPVSALSKTPSIPSDLELNAIELQIKKQFPNFRCKELINELWLEHIHKYIRPLIPTYKEVFKKQPITEPNEKIVENINQCINFFCSLTCQLLLKSKDPGCYMFDEHYHLRSRMIFFELLMILGHLQKYREMISTTQKKLSSEIFTAALKLQPHKSEPYSLLASISFMSRDRFSAVYHLIRRAIHKPSMQIEENLKVLIGAGDSIGNNYHKFESFEKCASHFYSLLHTILIENNCERIEFWAELNNFIKTFIDCLPKLESEKSTIPLKLTVACICLLIKSSENIEETQAVAGKNESRSGLSKAPGQFPRVCPENISNTSSKWALQLLLLLISAMIHSNHNDYLLPSIVIFFKWLKWNSELFNSYLMLSIKAGARNYLKQLFNHLSKEKFNTDATQNQIVLPEDDFLLGIIPHSFNTFPDNDTKEMQIPPISQDIQTQASTESEEQFQFSACPTVLDVLECMKDPSEILVPEECYYKYRMAHLCKIFPDISADKTEKIIKFEIASEIAEVNDDSHNMLSISDDETDYIKGRMVVIDASNIAIYIGEKNKKVFDYKRIEYVVNYFTRIGCTVFVAFSENIYGKDNNFSSRVLMLEKEKCFDYINQLQREQKTLEIPAGKDDDRYFIMYAYRNDGCIVSNDRFRQHANIKNGPSKEWIRTHVINICVMQNGDCVLNPDFVWPKPRALTEKSA